ncbi:MAG TPA: protein-glutamate O-methyltransferase CheR [Verrucomicrobiae bacterium]|nr:protein-glutamate O-methyltransferase CheR [Verrucomicrobiae bacterium]
MALAQEAPLSLPNGISILLRDLVHERIGMYFDTSRLDTMLEKLQEPARARNCQSLLDYYYLLKYDHDGAAEWEKVMDALSVQETYFWREFPQVQLLVEVIVPAWFATHHTTLRIWSAACATGEEPYTVALALQEAGWGNHPIDIVASDASVSALDKARQGLFRERSFRSLSPELRARYFTEQDGRWQLDSSIIRRVKFHRANIVSRQEIGHLAEAPVVFCRNVFIYFSPEAIRKTLSTFAQFMPSHAYLFVGASESLIKLTSDFDLEEMNDAFVYVRKPRPEEAPSA